MSKISVDKLSSPDGHTFEVRYPSSFPVEKLSSVILVAPAMGAAAKAYDLLLLTFAKNGQLALSFDLRGQGTSSLYPDAGVSFGYKEVLDYDFPTLINHINQKYDVPIFLLGHSLGGQLFTLYSGTKRKEIKALLLITACSVYYKGWDGYEKIKVFFFSQLFSVVGSILGYFPGNRFGFGGRVSKGTIKDWAYQARTGVYKITNASDNREQHLKDVNIPVLSISFENDFLAPEKAVLNLLKKVPQANVTHHHHNDGKLDHFSWLRRPAAIVQEILEYTRSI
jgi:predicted alpha/beta hydrolase